jgi:hypothetical protein
VHVKESDISEAQTILEDPVAAICVPEDSWFVDEAGAIPLTVLRAAEQTLSNCTFS